MSERSIREKFTCFSRPSTSITGEMNEITLLRIAGVLFDLPGVLLVDHVGLSPAP